MISVGRASHGDLAVRRLITLSQRIRCGARSNSGSHSNLVNIETSNKHNLSLAEKRLEYGLEGRNRGQCCSRN